MSHPNSYAFKYNTIIIKDIGILFNSFLIHIKNVFFRWLYFNAPDDSLTRTKCLQTPLVIRKHFKICHDRIDKFTDCPDDLKKYKKRFTKIDKYKIPDIILAFFREPGRIRPKTFKTCTSDLDGSQTSIVGLKIVS